MSSPVPPNDRVTTIRTSSIPVPASSLKPNLNTADNPTSRDRPAQSKHNSSTLEDDVKTIRPPVRPRGSIPQFLGKENTPLSLLLKNPSAIMPAVTTAAAAHPPTGTTPTPSREGTSAAGTVVRLGILKAVGAQLPSKNAHDSKEESTVVDEIVPLPSANMSTKSRSTISSIPGPPSTIADFEFPNRSASDLVADYSIPSVESEYLSHLKSIEANPRLNTVRSKISHSLLTPTALTTPSTSQPKVEKNKDERSPVRTDIPTAAVYAENAVPSDVRASGDKVPADVTLQLQLRSADRRNKHGPAVKRIMHHRTVSTLSVSSVASLHGSNLPGWEEFDTLPRDIDELTSFPKYQSNSMRTSSLKRIGAKIMGEEAGTGIGGIGRFFTRVWPARQPAPLPRRGKLFWEEDGDVSDAESRIIDLNSIAEAGRKSEDKDKKKTHSRAGSLVDAVKTMAIDIKGKAVERTRCGSTASSNNSPEEASKTGEVSRKESKTSLKSAAKTPTGSNKGIFGSVVNCISVGSRNTT